MIEIAEITAEDARPIRKVVLRPNLPWEETIYPGDDCDASKHFGAFIAGDLVGVSSIYRHEMPGMATSQAWQLRGVAVLPHAQRSGCGRLLVQECISYVAGRGEGIVWANGRTTVIPFYRSLGFQTSGEEFYTKTGPHYRLWLAIQPSSNPQ